MKTFLIHNFLFSFIEIMDLVILGGDLSSLSFHLVSLLSL